MARFRFVTARELSVRFGVTEQRVNVRVRRLLAAGLLGELRPHVSASRVVFISRRGSLELGLGPRRPPRTDVQRRHELELAMLVAHMERGLPLGEQRVMTERECRRAERASEGADRYSVEVLYRYERKRRWPDLVLTHQDGHKRAIEIELAVKHTERLEQIITGYYLDGTFSEVLWLVENPALEARLRAIVADSEPVYGTTTQMRVTGHQPVRC